MIEYSGTKMQFPHTLAMDNAKEALGRYLPALLSGAVLVFAFPPFNLSFLALVCIAPLLVSLQGMDRAAAFRSGLLFGLVYFLGTQYWIYHSINHYGGLLLPVSLAVVLLLCLYEALYTAFFGLLTAEALRRTDLPLTITAAPLWVSLEYVRGYLFTGFPWSLLGYTQHNAVPLIQISDLTGVYGVSLLVILVNTALSDLVLLKRRRAERPLHPPAKAILSAAAVVLVMAAALLYGFRRLDATPAAKDEGRRVRVSIVQGNIDQSVKWDPGRQRSILQTYKRLTRASLRDDPDMIVWPETALPFYYGTDRTLTEEVNGFVREIGVPLLTGTVLIKGENHGAGTGPRYTLSNSAVLIGGDGKLSYVYDKIHLVPFGEYVPLKKLLFFVDRLVEGIGDYQAGRDYVKADTSWGRFSTVICYEIIFPGLVRRFFTGDGDLIVNITNDAWFGRTSGPYQHFGISVFRAVENRKPLVRAANTGISGFIDASGRVLASTRLFEEGYLTADIVMNRGSDPSFYSVHGDLFSYSVMVLTVLVFGFIWGRNRKPLKIKL